MAYPNRLSLPRECRGFCSTGENSPGLQSRMGLFQNRVRLPAGRVNCLPAANQFSRYRPSAKPVLSWKPRDSIEFALVVGDDAVAQSFGVSGDQKIVAADELTAFFQSGA